MKQLSRNSSVELLRIIAMCGVVILHYNNADIGGGFRHASGLNLSALMLLESLFICAVDLYILISGYFLSASSNRKLIKPLELIIQVCAFGLLRYMLSTAISGSFSFSGAIRSMIPNNYFVALYVTLYFISPYLNRLYDHISNKQLQNLTVLMLLLFSLWPTLLDLSAEVLGHSYDGMSTINAFGSQRGYTIVNFVLMYTLGACIRRNEASLKKFPAAVVLVICIGLITLWSHWQRTSAWAYHNPLVILSACASLVLFLRWHFTSKLVNSLAKSAFTCFLFHTFFMGRIGIAKAAVSSLPAMLIHILVSTIVIYLICYIAYWIWELATGWFFRLLKQPLSKLDRFISLDDNQ